MAGFGGRGVQRNPLLGEGLLIPFSYSDPPTPHPSPPPSEEEEEEGVGGAPARSPPPIYSHLII